MKSAIKIFILLLVFHAGTPQKASAQTSINFQLFYDDLSPYGYWVDNSDYGYVWVPNVAPGFTPYGTNGHWVLTNAGWTWYSDYSWGWAPFHYGRWYSDPVYGPMWVPGNEWGPGWVTWRSSPDYYGWAPIGPGVSVELAYSNGYTVPYNQWVFVRGGDFGRSNISNYYVDRSTNTTIINNSTVINNIQADGSSGTKYNAGPRRTDVEKRAGRTVTPVVIKESNQRGQKLSNGELQIYKPKVQKEVTSGKKSAPAKVSSLNEVKPAAERNPNVQSPGKNQPGKQVPAKQQQHGQHSNEHPAQHQQNGQPVKQQPSQQQQNGKHQNEQPAQHQQGGQPDKQQPSQQQHQSQPKKEQPVQHKQDGQPAKQQPSQQQQDQPKKEQPAQHQPSNKQHSQPHNSKSATPPNPPQQTHEQQPQPNHDPNIQQEKKPK